MNEKVSIIVPIYNVEQYIRKCLASLLEQTYKNIEIYAVSDGTPDNSMSIVEEFAKNDNRVIPLYKENGGYGSVLEYAINKIESKYFLICDPDDWMKKDAIEKLINAAEKNNCDLVVGDMYMTYSSGNNDKYYKCCHNNYIVHENKVYDESDGLGYFAFMGCSPHSKLYLTSNAKNIVFPHKVSYTDTLLYLVALSRSNRCMYLSEALSYYYFDRPGNTANELKKISYTYKTFKAQMIVLEETFNQIKNNNPYIMYRLYCEAISMSRKLKYMSNNKKESKKRLFEFIKKIMHYKKNIYPIIKENNKKILFLKKVVFRLMGIKLVSNVVFNIIINFNFSFGRGGSHE